MKTQNAWLPRRSAKAGRSFIILYVLPLLMALASCSADKEKEQARELFSQAGQSFEQGDFTRSLSLLDSLQRAYPAQIEIQREGMALRPRVIEGVTLREISTADSLSVIASLQADSLKSYLRYIKEPRMVEGYYVAKEGYNPALLNTTGIQGRVSEGGEFYLLASVNPCGSNLATGVTISSGSAQASTPDIPFDGNINCKIENGQLITFSPAQSDTIGIFAIENAGRPLSLTINGKSPRRLALTAAQVNALAQPYAYSAAVADCRRLALERQRLESTLQLARDQIARTAADPVTTPHTAADTK